jgi:hypothetical protein
LNACIYWPRMVIRLLCMMIDALRCAGIAYSYGMMRCFSLPLYLIVFVLIIQILSIPFPILCFGRVSDRSQEKQTRSMQETYSKHKHEGKT